MFWVSGGPDTQTEELGQANLIPTGVGWYYRWPEAGGGHRNGETEGESRERDLSRSGHRGVSVQSKKVSGNQPSIGGLTEDKTGAHPDVQGKQEGTREGKDVCLTHTHTRC